MKRVILIGLASLVLAAAHSSVYACDHTANASKQTRVTRETVTTADAKTIRTLVVGATTGCRTVDSVVAFDIDVPGRTVPKYIHLEAAATAKKSCPSALRTAMTLGRALVTTIEAVMGELFDAASEKTAALV
jgi:hypothetical protein